MKPKLVLVAGVALLAAAIAVDATSPGEPPKPATVGVAGTAGVLACPLAVPSAGRAYLHLANIGDAPAHTRILITPDSGEQVELPATVAPKGAIGVRLHGRIKGGGSAFVLYRGAVVASHTGWLGSGAYGAACQEAGSRRLVLAHSVTFRTRSILAVANPGNSDADVSVALLVDGDRVEPETLTKFIVPPKGRRLFRLQDFVFDAADVTALVQAEAGRVVAQTLVQNAYGVSALGGGPARPEVVDLVGLSDGIGAISVAAVGLDEEAAIRARLIEPSQQGAAPRIPPQLAPADSVRVLTSRRPGAGPLAYSVSVTAGAPIAVGSSWRRGSGDRAALEGVGTAASWAGVLGLETDGGVRALLANTGNEPASVRLTLLGPEGAQVLEVMLPPGRTTAQALGTTRGTYGVVVSSDVPVSLALDGIVRRSERLVAVPGIPLRAPAPVTVRQDPQAGVPGRKPGT